MRQWQNGSALGIALIVILLLTVLGISSLRTGTVEEVMVGNLREQSLAFEAAEAALRAGEDYVAQRLGAFSAADLGPLCATGREPALYCAGTDNPAPTDVFDTTLWEPAAGEGPAATLPYGMAMDLEKDPRFFMELLTVETLDSVEIGAVSRSIATFRVVARGQGRNPNAVVVLSSFYGIELAP